MESLASLMAQLGLFDRIGLLEQQLQQPSSFLQDPTRDITGVSPAFDVARRIRLQKD